MQIVDLDSMNYGRFLMRTSIMMKTIINIFKRLLLACTLFIASISVSSAADLPKLKIAVLGFGTVLWELDTIKHYGLDIVNGFDLEVTKMASGSASRVAFQANETDAIVADWLWVAIQKNKGRDYVFAPYSLAVGEMLVPGNSGIRSLKDLKGKSIGIAGGPLDKSWLIFQSYAAAKLGFDLKAETEQVFGAPPLMFKKALSGELDAVINYWHFTAKMKSRGMRSILSVADTSSALGLDSTTPLLGYVFNRALPTSVSLMPNMVRASHGAKKILLQEQSAWDRLRPLMKAKNDSDFEFLVNGFRAGVPTEPVNLKSVQAMLNIMRKSGGDKLVAELIAVPDDLFYAAKAN
jgi:NitT/TauT family transport system substrate-binding protein